MYYKRTDYPEEDELVMCTVTNVQYNSVFVRLDDFNNKSGLIHISEVSPGRIRNLRDFVKEGKVVICKVLRVNLQRGHIDVSLRRVNEAQRRSKVEERKAEQKAEKIVETLATQLKKKPQEVYDAVAEKIIPEYGMLSYAFTDVVENGVSLEEIGVPLEYAKDLQALVIERIKPKEVLIEGDLQLVSYAIDGLEKIKKILIDFDASNDQITIRYLGAGAWRVEINAPEFKDAEKILKDALEPAQKAATEADVKLTFKRKEA